MKDFITRMLCEPDGTPSSMRVIFLIGAITFIMAPTFIWTLCCLLSKPITILPIPESVTLYFGQAMAVIMSCKVWQKNIENK